MSGSVGGNQSVGANVGANGARGTEQTQLLEAARTTGKVHGSAATNDDHSRLLPDQQTPRCLMLSNVRAI